jgi:hypothetical protein
MREAGNVARMGQTRGTYRCYWGNVNEKDNLEALSADGKIILKLILNKSFGRARSALILPGIGRSGGACKHCNELSSFIKCG